MKVHTLKGRIRAAVVCDCDDGWRYVGGVASRCRNPHHRIAGAISAARVPARLLEAMRGGPDGLGHIDPTADRLPLLERYGDLWTGALGGALLIGDVDTGKSHTAAWLLRQAAQMGIRSLWCTASQIDAEVKATFGGDGDRSAVVERYADVPLLVIDEMRSASAFTAELLGDVIRERYERAAGAVHPTVITANGDEAAVAAALEPHIWSRLRSMAAVFELKGEGRRGVAA